MKLHLPLSLLSALLVLYSASDGFAASIHNSYNYTPSFAAVGRGVSYIGYSDSLIFRYNVAEWSAGCFSNDAFSGGTMRFENNRYVYFSDNIAKTGEGGCLDSQSISIANNEWMVFKNNSATTGGAISCVYGGNTIRNVDTLIFEGNTAFLYGGGAIRQAGYNLLIQSCERVEFRENSAVYGGAIQLEGLAGVSSRLEISNNKDFLFQNNEAVQKGGAICTTYCVDVLGNRGSVEFIGNKTEECGGAIYLSGCNFNDDYTFRIQANNEIIFRDNVAGETGGAIYSASTYKYAKGYIVDNGRVIFENNQGGAINSMSGVSIYGNDYVLFKDNGIAITAPFVRLSTKNNEASALMITDSLEISGNVDIHDYTDSKGTVWLLGNNSQSLVSGNMVQYRAKLRIDQGAGVNVGGSAHLYSGTWHMDNGATMQVNSDLSIGGGTMHLENGAAVDVKGGVSINGGKLIVSQPAYTYGASTSSAAYIVSVGGGMNIADTGSSQLFFELKNPAESEVPMVKLAGVFVAHDASVVVDDSALQGASAHIALLQTDLGFSCNDVLYTYDGTGWVEPASGLYFDINQKWTLTNGEDGHTRWIGNTLYYTSLSSSCVTYKVKGFGESLTWRGDIFGWYDTNKVRVEVGGDGADLTCWLAVSANMIQYWQDRYAPLYQGGEMLTTNLTRTTSADTIYQCLLDAVSWDLEASGNCTSSNRWWFTEPITDAADRAKFKITEQDNGWAAYDFSQAFRHDNIGKQRGSLQKVIAEVFNRKATETALGLAFDYIGEDGNPLQFDSNGNDAAHVVTVWKAEFDIDPDGEPICRFFYTDSDHNADTLSTMTVKYQEGVGYYIYQYSANRDQANEKGYLRNAEGVLLRMELTGVYSLCTPDGMEQMLQDYKNGNTLLWTGKAEGNSWQAGLMPENSLATPTCGWQKKCSDGLREVYAHAYFTQAQVKDTHFVFGDILMPGVKNVAVDGDLAPASVTVSGNGYCWQGQGVIGTDSLIITDGASLSLSGGVRLQGNIGTGTIELNGLLSGVEAAEPCISGYGIMMGDDAELWCCNITVSQAADGENDFTLNGEHYVIEGIDKVITNVTLENSGGAIGSRIVFGDGVTNISPGDLAACESLHAALYNALNQNDGVAFAGDVTAYQWIFAPVKMNYTQDGSVSCGASVVVADSTLTIATPVGLHGVARSLGSYTNTPSETMAEICLSEKLGGSIIADTRIETIPGESVYLNSISRLETPDLQVLEYSDLGNDGRIIGNIMVEADACLYGRGSFGATQVQSGGCLMVGSSPGAPQYESVAMAGGSELIFCLDGTEPADADEYGWGSGTHSVLRVTEPGGLVVENGTTVTVGCSEDFLKQATWGDAQAFDLIQLSDSADAALLANLQTGTRFMLARADDSLSALADVGVAVHHAYWQQTGSGAVQLRFIVSNCPDDALVWTNDSGDACWNTDSVNWTQSDGETVAFADGRNVAFYEGGQVALRQTLSPGEIVVSTPDRLEIAGSGALCGVASLIKEGSGELVLATSNPDFGGAVYINGGSVTAAAEQALGQAFIYVDNAGLDMGGYAGPDAVQVCGNSTLSGLKQLFFIGLEQDAAVRLRGGDRVAASRTLFVGGNNTVSGDLTLDGGTLSFLLPGLNVEGITSFTVGSTTTIDLSQWQGETSGSLTLAHLGEVQGYTAGSLLLSGVADDEAYLKLNASNGELTLIFGKNEQPEEETVSTPGLALSVNEQEVYRVIGQAGEEASINGELKQLFAALDTASDDEALKQLLAEVGGSEYATLMSSQIDGNMAHLRRLRAQMGQGHLLDGGEGLRASVDVYSQRSDVDADARGRGFTRSETGGQFTLEFEDINGMLGGVAMSAGYATLQPDNALKQKVDNTVTDFYGVYSHLQYTGKFALGVGSHRYNLKRCVLGQETQAETSGFSISLMHESAYGIQLGEQSALCVFGAIDSSLNRINGFCEEGAGNASLVVDSQSAWATDITLGVRYETMLGVFNMPKAKLGLQVGVTASVGDTGSDICLRYAGLPRLDYVQHAVEQERVGLNVGGNIYIPVGRDKAVYVGGEAVLRGDYTGWNANIGMQIAF